METTALNFLAVLVAAVVHYVLGALWYSPLLFGKAWVKNMGWSEEHMKSMKEKGSMWKPYLAGFVTSFVMAYVFAHIIDFSGAVTWQDGAVGGVWMWLGFVATIMLGRVLWEGEKISSYFINAGYYLVGLVVMGSILATMG